MKVTSVVHAVRLSSIMGAEIKKILLVEDNDECRKILTRNIRHLGYDVIQADTGLDGIDRAASEHPDLIVISLDFPRMRGLDVTISLKNNPQTYDIPILVYPPWDSEEATEAALKAGATEVLKEPITLQSFHQALQKYAPSGTKLDRRNMFYSSPA
jgi:two-component system cell cycle response regulator DivK